MSDVTNLDDFRRRRDSLIDRICDDEAVDVFLTAFWDQTSYGELLDSPNLRRKTTLALAEVRDYLKGRDSAA